MKYLNHVLSLASAVAVSILIIVSPAAAAEPWTWRTTLEGASSGQSMEMPTALHIDAERQRYYVVDSGGNRLLSFSREGGFLHTFTAEGKLQIPFDMVRDDADLIWVVEKGRNSLTSIDVKAKAVTPHILKDGERTLVPDRLEFKGGTFYVLDKATGEIALLGKDLVVKKWITCAECGTGIVDFKLAADGGIWALDQLDKKVVRFDGEGKTVQSFAVAEHVEFPVSLAVDSAGNVYVLDRHKAGIAVFDPQGGFKYAFLAKGWSRGELYYPIEIVFDPWGGLCVVEEGNGRVEVFGR
jgi:streptogramin lyase